MADKDEIQAATALFNEVINSDITALAERIDLGAPINFIGTCGEAPLHIAIYKRDDNMIRMLIDAGADIMFGNSNLDTALHIAARMGLPRVVEYLYDGASALNKKRLFLEAKNQDALTALQIACMPVRHWELDLTRLYRSWDHKKDPSLDDELFPLQHGRLECRAFLKEKMELDVRNKEKGSVADMVDQNFDFARAAGILRGRDTSNFSSRIFYSALDYPAKLDANVWNEDDKQFFLDYLPGVREVMTRLHSADVVGKTTKSGFESATLIQRQHELILLSRKGEGRDSRDSLKTGGVGLQETGLYKQPVPALGKLRLIQGEGEGEGEGEKEVLYPETDGTMVYICDNTAADAHRPGAEDRTDRVDSATSPESPRVSRGSARIRAAQQEQADAVVARALQRCQEEQHGANEEKRRQQAAYVPHTRSSNTSLYKSIHRIVT